jgi:hypothetical protein
MTAKVVTLARKERDMSEYDKVFFPKEAILRGTKLINYGRRDPGSRWTVTDIRTYVRKPSGYYLLETTPTILHLSDIITLKREPHDDAWISHREPTFGSISYSAIWRLA